MKWKPIEETIIETIPNILNNNWDDTKKIDLLVSLEITQDTVYFLCYSKYRCNMRLNAVLMVVLIASMSGSIAYANNSNQPDTSKMSYELISALDSTDEIEVIIQFTEEQDSSVWQSFETMGIQMISELSVLHGGLIVGKPTDISQLSTFSIVKHMELNVPIEHFYLPGDQNNTESMMHETVRWVNASLAWHRAP